MTEPGRNRFYCTVSLHGLKWKNSAFGLWDLCVGALQVVPAHAKMTTLLLCKGDRDVTIILLPRPEVER
jgi:hypothetical protein